MHYNKTIIEKEAEEIYKKIDFSQLKGKKILITGASGIIGIYLTACLKEFSNNEYIDIHLWIKNEIDLKHKWIFDSCFVFKQDITNISNIENLQKYDIIIHAAGYGQPNKFLHDKIKTIELNTAVTSKLLSLLKPDGKFLFISTSELYSGNDSENITEEQIGNTNTNQPRAAYIEGKRCGEAICYSYNNPNIKIARLSLAYGAGTKPNDDRVLNQLVQKGLTGDNITLMDDGSAIRTYLYISDCVEMLFNILLHGKEQLYNVGGKSKTSILDLAKLIGSKLKKPVIAPQSQNALVGNPKIVNISIDKYIKEFNKTDFVSLEEGITNTIEWQKQLYGNN